MTSTELFNTISVQLPQLTGWGSVEKGHALAGAVLALSPNVSLEIGVWGGRSFFPMAWAHKHIGKGVVWGIDPWSPAASMVGQEGEHRVWWGGAEHEPVYQQFMANVERWGLAPYCKILRAPSDSVDPPAVIDLMSLDGNHGPQAERDVARFCPNIRKGGLVFVDDLDWQGGAVRRAVANLKSMGFIELTLLDTGAVYQRV